MTEPATSVIVTNVISTALTGAGIVILGVQTGLEYPTLIAGVLGGATALSYQEPTKVWIRAFQVITAALFAGYSAPVASAVLLTALNKLALVGKDSTDDGIVLCLAFVIAYLTHGVILPGLRKIGNAFVGRYSRE
jgi:hypothetical protein